LREQLGVLEGTSITTNMLLSKLKSLKGAEAKVVRLRIFYLILISSYLVPTMQNKADKFAVYCTRDIAKIADYDWCSIVYEHLRKLSGLEKMRQAVPSMVVS